MINKHPELTSNYIFNLLTGCWNFYYYLSVETWGEQTANEMFMYKDGASCRQTETKCDLDVGAEHYVHLAYIQAYYF